jgi:hypothetical protein
MLAVYWGRDEQDISKTLQVDLDRNDNNRMYELGAGNDIQGPLIEALRKHTRRGDIRSPSP